MSGATVYTTHPLATGVPPEWASEWGQDEHGVFAGFTVGRVTQRLRWIPPGTFLMGSPLDEPERYDDETQHAVHLTQGLWLADTACTQALWQALMDDNPSGFTGPQKDDTSGIERIGFGPLQRPVETVSFDDVQEFLKRLHARMGEPDDGLVWRLPTEAEWEYACRAGTTTPFSFGANITPEQVNYDGNYPYAGGTKGRYRKETVPVGSLPANPWGLYEMHGNVWEWCSDRLGKYPSGLALDPEGPSTGSDRVLRGGSWFDRARDCRSARRIADVPGYRSRYVGFRVARGPVREPAGGARSSAGG